MLPLLPLQALLPPLLLPLLALLLPQHVVL